MNNEPQRFPGVSKWAYNIIAMYEKPMFSARLAYNYRSKFVTYYSLEALDPIAHGIIEKGRGQIDFSTSVTPVPNITLASSEEHTSELQSLMRQSSAVLCLKKKNHK